MAERFDLVIIGGGILGIATAYHAVRMGAVSVLVLERNQIASQATPRAAALLTQIRYKPSQLHIVQRTFAAIAAWGVRPMTRFERSSWSAILRMASASAAWRPSSVSG